MLRQDDYQKTKLVEAGWRWGKEYGGYRAACMIMWCLANRVRLGWGSWLDVIDSIPRFAAQTEIPTGTPSIWEPSFVKLLHEVEGIFAGTGDDLSKGAVYWGDLRRIETPFFKEKIMGDTDKHPRVADMNSLSFWR